MPFSLPYAPDTNGVWRWSARVLRPALLLITRRGWVGARPIPQQGGAVVALNHLSQIDPILTTHYMWEHHGRLPSYLAKQSLFENRTVGWWFRNTGHICVDRTAGSAAIEPAVDAVRDGKVALVYIEGSITRDPDGWPMVPKTGAARIALQSGAPVIPVAQWGAQNLMEPYSGKLRLRGRTDVTFRAGEPVDLSDLVGRHDDADAVRQATDRIMAAIVALLEEIRGETAPADRYDPAAHGQSRYGSTGR